MAAKLRATVESDGETSLVKLVGFLDEENKLKRLVEQIPAGTAMIDLAGVERINSNGIRDWVNWMSALEQNGTRPVLVGCSPAIVAQINLVKNFTGHGAVKSFQVPYHCRECDEDKTILVETSEMSSPAAPPPTVRCESCDRDMDVDEMPESYFAFLGQVHLEELARGSMSSVVKSRVKTRRGGAPARQSQPSLSAYQTPAQGTPRLSSQDMLGKKRPSAPRIALGSSNRISGSTLPPETYERTPGTTPTPKSYTMLLIAIIGVLLAGIAALSYVVFVQ